MDTKAYHAAVKSMGEGKVLARLATKGVIDRQNDVLVDGILGGRVQVVAIKPQHQIAHVNLGVASIWETPTALEASLKYNLDIPSAKDWYEATRFSFVEGHDFSYSFGFFIEDHAKGVQEGRAVRLLKRIAINECSPVLTPASIGSGTLEVKADDWRLAMVRRLEMKRRLWPRR